MAESKVESPQQRPEQAGPRPQVQKAVEAPAPQAGAEPTVTAPRRPASTKSVRPTPSIPGLYLG